MAPATIFITGAGSGIGAATARLFHGHGWIVGAYDLDPASVRELATEPGEGCIPGRIDVTQRASVATAFEEFGARTGGRLDILCNNAGVFDDVAFAEQTPASVDAIVAVNVSGVVNCSQAAFGLLKATPGARLINISSAASVYGIPNESVYSGSKFFVRGLSEALHLEWREHGIDVAVIMPGYVATPMLDKAGHISWLDRFGVKLSAQDVAATVWKAARSNRLYWPMPGDTSLLLAVMRKLPLRLTPWFARRIFYGQGRDPDRRAELSPREARQWQRRINRGAAGNRCFANATSSGWRCWRWCCSGPTACATAKASKWS